MKTKFIAFFSIAIFTMLTVVKISAQKRDFTNESAYNFSSKEINRVSETKDVSKKALEYFHKKFSYATNVKWESVQKNYLALFSIDDTKVHVLINNKGKVIYSIIFSGENKLPPDIKNMVNDSYGCYSITSVAKVEIDSREIWVVKLAGAKNYVTARIENGEMNEIENFKKA